MSTKFQNQVAAAQLLADQAAPYFREARAAMPIVFCNSVPIMAVDKHWRCYVNPETIMKFPPQQIAYIILHELCHCLRQHADRREQGNLEPEKDNIASDFEINGQDWPGLQFPMLDGKQFGIKASNHPGWDYIPKLKEGLLMEEYYSLIPDPPAKPSGDKGQPDIGGSCADGVARPYELPGDDEEAPGLTPLEQTAKRMETAAKIQEHAKVAGSVPGDWVHWADTVLKPVVPWQQQLRHVVCSGVSKCGLGIQTYRRARQRDEIVMPRHHKRDPVVLILGDMSGSMGRGEGSNVHRVFSEAIHIAKQVGQVDAVWWDTQPHHQKNIRRITEIKGEGGGGTDPEPAILFANKLKNSSKPDLLVIVSDGICAWPLEPPKHPVVTVIIGNQGTQPKWGKIVRIAE